MIENIWTREDELDVDQITRVIKSIAEDRGPAVALVVLGDLIDEVISKGLIDHPGQAENLLTILNGMCENVRTKHFGETSTEF